jgi:hypothetical protein
MKNFRNQQPQCVPNQEDNENAGYENFDNANVAASLLIAAPRKADYKSFMSFQKVPPHLVFNFCLYKNYYNNRLILNKLYLPF